MAVLIHIGVIICIYVIVALSLNVAVGYTGLMNFGHIAFFGLGAYVSALLTLSHVPFLVALGISGLCSAILGVGLVVVTRNLASDYFALATLGFAFIFESILVNWKNVTRGSLGIPGIPKPNIFGISFTSNQSYLVVAIIFTILSALFVYRVVRSRYGRLLEAVRDDAVGLEAMGVSTLSLKCVSMAVSTFFIGIAGSLYAHYITYIDPTSFMLTEVVLLFTIIIVGGLGSLRGSIIGAVVVILIPELLRFINIPSSVIGPVRQIFYSLILIAIVLWRPQGICGRIELR